MAKPFWGPVSTQFKAPIEQARPTGRDKTSLLLVTRDEPGILYRVLGAFAQRGLNMSKIESRPSRRRPWEYVFFVDIDGHQSDQPVAAALADVRPSCETLKVLGSYPRAEPLPAPAAAG